MTFEFIVYSKKLFFFVKILIMMKNNIPEKKSMPLLLYLPKSVLCYPWLPLYKEGIKNYHTARNGIKEKLVFLSTTIDCESKLLRIKS